MSNVVGIKFYVTVWTVISEVSCCWGLQHCWKCWILRVGELLLSCSELPSEGVHQSFSGCKADISSPRRNIAFPAVLFPVTLCKVKMSLFTFVGACVASWQLLGPWKNPMGLENLNKFQEKNWLKLWLTTLLHAGNFLNSGCCMTLIGGGFLTLPNLSSVGVMKSETRQVLHGSEFHHKSQLTPLISCLGEKNSSIFLSPERRQRLHSSMLADYIDLIKIEEGVR